MIDTNLKIDELLRNKRVGNYLLKNASITKSNSFKQNNTNNNNNTKIPCKNEDCCITRNNNINQGLILSKQVFTKLTTISESSDSSSIESQINLSGKNKENINVPKENPTLHNKPEENKSQVLTDSPKNMKIERIILENYSIMEINLDEDSISIDKENSRISEPIAAYNVGTTANIALMINNYLYVSNVGDSISVLYKAGEAKKLNQEHKTSLPAEASRILNSGKKICNNRIDNKLNLTRAIGTENL